MTANMKYWGCIRDVENFWFRLVSEAGQFGVEFYMYYKELRCLVLVFSS